ncbi:MAG: FlgO family outer membrane protein [Endomicrobiales bacterium]
MMKTPRTFVRLCLAVIVLALLSSPAISREDPYNKMAKELSEAAPLLAHPKVAIMPFSYIDKRKSDSGAIISERLTTRLVKLKKYTVIERQLLESVLQELHLESSGVIDAETTKQLGKVLGVDAIIAGTLMDIGPETVEVNARVIKTESAEVISTSSIEVEKTWPDVAVSPDVAASAPVQQAPQQDYSPAPQQKYSMAAPVQQQPQQVRAYPPKKFDSYFDVMVGGGSGTMDLKFKNTVYSVRETDIDIDLNNSGYIESGSTSREVSFLGAKTQSSSLPIGLRISGFGKHFGGGVEISFYSQRIIKQRAAKFNFSVDDYLSVSVMNFGGDFMARLSDKMIQPYLGLGVGLTLNNVTSPYISGYNSGIWQKPHSEYSLGFLFKVPVGIRVMIGDSASLFAEYRMVSNFFYFDRGIKSEKDSVSMTTNLTLFGASAHFR